MWKHDILSDLMYGAPRLKKGEFRSLVEYWLDILQHEAQSIYAGDLTGHVENLLKTKDTVDFEGANPPFDSVLVMVRLNGKKRAIIVKNTNNTISFFTIVTSESSDAWVPSTFAVRCVDGGKFEYVGDSRLNADGEDAEEAKGYCQANALLALMVFKILNCKNVYLDKVDPPEALNRKRVKKGKLPLFRYHVLKVTPGIINKTTNHTATDKAFDSQPVHLCRGHFKHYAEDKPLFGIPGNHGRFWFQPHARGNKQNGIVAKDYELNIKQ